MSDRKRSKKKTKAWMRDPSTKTLLEASVVIGRRIWALKRKVKLLKIRVKTLEAVITSMWISAVKSWVDSQDPKQQSHGDEFMPGTTNITVDGTTLRGAIYVKAVSNYEQEEHWATRTMAQMTGPVNTYKYSYASTGSDKFDAFISANPNGYRADTTIKYLTPPTSASGLPAPPSGAKADQYKISCKTVGSSTYVEQGELYRIRVNSTLVHDHWRLWKDYTQPDSAGSKVLLDFVQTEGPDLDAFLQRSQSKGGSYVFAELNIKPIS